MAQGYGMRKFLYRLYANREPPRIVGGGVLKSSSTDLYHAHYLHANIRMVKQGQIAGQHGAQVVARLVVSYTIPNAFPIADQIINAVHIGLRFEQPVIHAAKLINIARGHEKKSNLHIKLLLSAMIPENAFVHSIQVHPSHLDQLQHVNNVVYVQWVQDAAAAHWQQLNAEAKLAVAWVVLRHEIDYLLPTHADEQLWAHTWVGETSSTRSWRHVHILNMQGNCVLQAKTMWCAIDEKKNRPMRVNEELIRILASPKK